jgi:hypothetical protein
MSLTKSSIYSTREILNQIFDTASNTLNIASSPAPATSIGSGRKTVTTAGTAVTLASSTPAKRVTITALDTNTGVITVGGSGVIAASGTRTGVPLSAGDSYELDIDNLSKVYIDATVSGEGVSFTYFS